MIFEDDHVNRLDAFWKRLWEHLHNLPLSFTSKVSTDHLSILQHSYESTIRFTHGSKKAVPFDWADKQSEQQWGLCWEKKRINPSPPTHNGTQGIDCVADVCRCEKRATEKSLSLQQTCVIVAWWGCLFFILTHRVWALLVLFDQ